MNVPTGSGEARIAYFAELSFNNAFWMSLDQILLLGDKRLYEPSSEVLRDEIGDLQSTISILHDLVIQFRARYGKGRAIAAPQIGLLKRIICYNVDKPVTIINPVLSEFSDEMIEIWDDCMSFPELLVKVRRHQSCRMTFRDAAWNKRVWNLSDDLSELFQHEFDHLNGILATDRALDLRSLKLASHARR
jgi:peptide deformylase